MHRALLELTIEGVETSRDFHLRVLEDAEFRDGAIEIQWLERRLADLTNRTPPAEGVIRAAIAAVLLAERERSVPRPPVSASPESMAKAEPDRTNWLRASRQEGLR